MVYVIHCPLSSINVLAFSLCRAGSEQKTRLEKLQNIIKKLYNNYGTITNEYWPIDSNNKTKG